MDLASSVEFHRAELAEADAFAGFLSEVYDSKELIFYLYNRSLLEKSLKLNFSNITEEEIASSSLVFHSCREEQQDIRPGAGRGGKARAGHQGAVCARA